ncbi:MAG: hypothetical protein VYC34_10080 [Planctomycetota bacterium]|nr:hypothetical protein [Planctomycetota bacterium]
MTSGFQPFAAQITGEVVACATVSIHGDLYHDIRLRSYDPNNPERTLRAPSHACARPPRAGDQVAIQLLLQQVTRVEFADLDSAADKTRANHHNDAPRA